MSSLIVNLAIIKTSSSCLLKNVSMISTRSLVFRAVSVVPQQQWSRRLTTLPDHDNDEKKRIFTIPNCLTVSRIAMTPYISYLMLSESYTYATGMFFLLGFTDFLDGYIARRFKSQKSYLGSILDPLADKVLIGVMTVTLGMCNLMPIEVMLIILGRDLALILSAIIIRYKLIEKPKTIQKFFNIRDHSSVKIEASGISKLNTLLQIFLISVSIPSELLAYNDSIYLKALQYLTASTTVISGVQYLLSRGSYKVMK